MTKVYFKKLSFVICIALTAALTFGSISESWANNSNTNMYQAQLDVKGKVVDSNGAPIVGASVAIDGTTKGDITDGNGQFTIARVAANSTVTVSFIGYDTKTVAAAQNLTITLNEAVDVLDEVVVVGYGTQKKESLTGSLHVIGGEELENITATSVENMLTGKVPGVYVSPGTSVGETGSIIIRGKSTINGSTDPLWVVDGVIVGSNAGTINADDIESMSVLKDAASTAIYGSQGANGVILITTKAAKSGQFTVTAGAKVGVTTVNSGNYSVMNGSELYDYFSSFSNQEAISFPRWNSDLRDSDFSWWDLATRTGVIQEYNVSVSGGTDKISSYFSGSVYDEIGAIKGYDYTKYNFRLKQEYKPYDFLTIKPSISGGVTDTEDRQYSVSSMYYNLPWDSAYDEDGNITENYSSSWVNSNSTNYLYDLQYNYGTSSSKTIMANLDFDVKLTDELTFSSINNYKWGGYIYRYYEDSQSSSASGVDGRVTQSQYDYNRRYTNQILRYSKQIGDHDISALAAYEFNDYHYENLYATGTGIISGLSAMDATALAESVSGGISEWAVQSVLFNASYSYKYKYLAQVSFRRDGASNFGVNARYGNFYSISGGWNIEKEDWFNVNKIDALKLRVSYGMNGNRPSALYPSYDLYSASGVSYNGESGLLYSQAGNEDLTWETSHTFNIGADFTAFNNRLWGSLDYYKQITDGLLFSVPVSGVTGVTSIYSNVGAVENNGVELSIGGELIRKKDFSWTVDFSISHNSNVVKELYDGCEEIINGGGSGAAGGASRLITPGLDCDTWYLKEWAGVDTETGAPTWYTTADDGSREVTFNYADADYVAQDSSYHPDFYGSLNTSFRYKKVDFGAVFGYSVGGTIYNYARTEYDSDGTYTDRNQMNLMDDWSRWEEPGDVATHPVATYNNSSQSGSASTRFLEDGSYLKLRSLSVGYTTSFPKMNLKTVRFAFTGENLFTLTEYSGVDPELAPVSGSVGGEVTTSIYPSTRKYMFSINITL